MLGHVLIPKQRPEVLYKKALLKVFQHKCFPVNIEKFLRTPILKNVCKRHLLLLIHSLLSLEIWLEKLIRLYKLKLSLNKVKLKLHVDLKIHFKLEFPFQNLISALNFVLIQASNLIFVFNIDLKFDFNVEFFFTVQFLGLNLSF